MKINSIIERLENGNSRYIKDSFDRKLQDNSRRGSLTGGQDLFAIILSCGRVKIKK